MRTEDRCERLHEAVSKANYKNTAAPSVKSEQKLVFGGLGSGLDKATAGWAVKYLFSSLLLIFPFLVAVLE